MDRTLAAKAAKAAKATRPARTATASRATVAAVSRPAAARRRAAAGMAKGGSGPNTVPSDIPDGRDDDIVARQLREAAMKETDPELRERLWEEYRQYKKGTQ